MSIALQRDQRITGTKADDTPGQSKRVSFTILVFVKDFLSLGNFQLVLSAKISWLNNENIVWLFDTVQELTPKRIETVN